VRRVASAVSACLLVSGLISTPVQSAFALEGDRISVSQAQGKTGEPVVITVSPYGVALTFVEVGELIENAWVIDSSNLGIGYDLPPGKGAKIVFLKAIKQVSTASPGTSLTVTTKTKAGASKVYNFLVEFSEAKPKYTIVRVYPDTMQSRPLASTVAVAPSAPSSPTQVAPSTAPKPVATTPPAAVPAPVAVTPPVATPEKTPEKASPAPVAVTPPATPEKTLPAPIAQNPTSSSASGAKERPIYTELRKIYPEQPTPTTVAVDPSNANTGGAASPNASVSSAASENASAVSIGVPEVATSSKSIQQRLFHHSQANALVRGLALANRTREVGYRSPIAVRVQPIIRDLRNGQNLQVAAKRYGVEWKVILRLLQLGDYKGEV
jgi:hypothetical protein